MADNTNSSQSTNKSGDGAEAYQTPKKGAFPWWLPLLLLLVAIPIAYAMFKPKDDKNTASQTPASTDISAGKPAPTGDMNSATPTSTGEMNSAAPTATDANTTVGGTTDEGTSGSQAGNKQVFSGKDIATGSTAAASEKGEPLSNVTDLVTATDKTAFLGRKVKFTDVKVLQTLTNRAFFVGTDDTAKMLVLLDKGMDAGPSGERVPVKAEGTVSLTGIVEAMPTQEILNQQYQLTGKNYDAVAKEPTYLHATVAQKK